MTHRLDRRTTALVAAIALAYAAASNAADQRSGDAAIHVAQAQPQTQAPSSTRPQGTASPGTQASMNVQAVRDLRMSQVIGMDVRNARGENLGDVKDLVVDTESGRIAYAVVAIGGFLGIGEKLSAFPMSSFKLAQANMRAGGATTDKSPGNPFDNDGVRGDKGPIGSDRTAGSNATGSGTAPSAGTAGTASRALPGRGLSGLHLVLDADPQRLKRAPNFDRDQWPDWNDAKYRGEVNRAAGVTDAGKVGRLVRGSQLLDADIRDAQKKDVGEVEDMVVDVRAGQVRYAVVDFDQAWTPVDKLVAVPMKALRASGDKGELVFLGDRAQIERAPSFEKNKWPDLNADTYRGSVDSYMSGWSGTSAPGAGMSGATSSGDSRGATSSRSGAAAGGTTDTSRSALATGSGTTTR